MNNTLTFKNVRKPIRLGQLLFCAIIAICALAYAAKGAEYMYATGSLFDGTIASNSTTTVSSPTRVQLTGLYTLSPTAILFEGRLKAAAAGTSNVIYQVQTSLDDVNWVNQCTITNALNGTNWTTVRAQPSSTNWANVKYLRVSTAATTQTNLVTSTLKYGYWTSR